jgi:hypothetical protein
MYIPYTLGYRVVNKRTYHFGELLVFPSEKSSTYVSVRLRFFLSPTRRISSKMVRSQLCLFWAIASSATRRTLLLLVPGSAHLIQKNSLQDVWIWMRCEALERESPETH